MLNFNEYLEQQQTKITLLLEERVQKLNENLKQIEKSYTWSDVDGSNLEQKIKAIEQQSKERYVAPIEKDKEVYYETLYKEHLDKMERLNEQYLQHFEKLQQQKKEETAKHQKAIQIPDTLDFVSNLGIDQSDQAPLIEFCKQFDRDYAQALENAYILKIKTLTATALANLESIGQKNISLLQLSSNGSQRQAMVDAGVKELDNLVSNYREQYYSIKDPFAEELFDYRELWYKQQDITSALIGHLAKYIEKRQLRYGEYPDWGNWQLFYMQDQYRHKLLQTEQESALKERWEEQQLNLEEDFRSRMIDALSYIQSDKTRLFELFKDYQLRIIAIERDYDLAWIELQRETEMAARSSRFDHAKFMAELVAFYEQAKTKLLAEVVHLPEPKTDRF